jgi:DNA polymerase-3 subunit chi
VTRVNFYVVADASSEARLQVAARLAEKAYRQGHSLFINAGSASEAEAIDELLWTFRPGSFIPHHPLTESLQGPVVVGWGQEPNNHDDVLINLALTPPAFFSRFQRVAEVVTQDTTALEAMREAWRFYKDRGYPLQKHDL